MIWAKLTPQGRIVLTLEHGAHTYGELRRESGLSDRWLIRKLSELIRAGTVTKDGRWYRLSGSPTIDPWERALYRRTHQLPALLNCLKEGFASIQAAILFGSTSDGSCGPDSDVDLLLVTVDGESWEEMHDYLIQAQIDLHIDLDPLMLSVDDFLATIQSREGGLVYGLINAYEVLLDRSGGRLTKALRKRVHDIVTNYTFLPEAKQWVATK